MVKPTCPWCGKLVKPRKDEPDLYDDDSVRILVCAQCGEAATWDHNNYRKLTDDEEINMSDEWRDKLSAMQEYFKGLRRERSHAGLHE